MKRGLYISISSASIAHKQLKRGHVLSNLSSSSYSNIKNDVWSHQLRDGHCMLCRLLIYRHCALCWPELKTMMLNSRWSATEHNNRRRSYFSLPFRPPPRLSSASNLHETPSCSTRVKEFTYTKELTGRSFNVSCDIRSIFREWNFKTQHRIRYGLRTVNANNKRERKTQWTAKIA